MTRQPAAMTLAGISLDHSSSSPLHQQLYYQLRKAILEGRLLPGAQLPSTRLLSTELGISRTTTQNAFEQLLAEGYLEGKVGSGTYVAKEIPEDMLSIRPQTMDDGRWTMDNNSYRPSSIVHRLQGISRRGANISRTPTPTSDEATLPRAFRPDVPALDAFPFDAWSRLVSRHLHQSMEYLLGSSEPAGYWPLRTALAAYLGATRGVRCTPNQVIIVSGSQQSFDLIARVLLDPGDTVLVEDPGYIAPRSTWLSAGARITPVPVDKEGFDIAAGISLCSDARMAYVTPSHQFPTGVTMSPFRRLRLLEWAKRTGAWVVEDGYGSEYRYSDEPLTTLQELDRDGRVIYAGTFRRTIFPSLRIGYLIVPADLVKVFVAARFFTEGSGPTLEQLVLTDFITEGHFARHLRRMRKLYEKRQQVLLDAARHELSGLLEVRPASAGVNVTGWLPEDADDQVAARIAIKYGVEVRPLSLQGTYPMKCKGLLLGYAAFNETQIQDGVRHLAVALRQAEQMRRNSSGALRSRAGPCVLTA